MIAKILQFKSRAQLEQAAKEADETLTKMINEATGIEANEFTHEELESIRKELETYDKENENNEDNDQGSTSE